MPRFSNNADVWISEDGETWIRVDTAYGSYAYNKTKYDELMNEPLTITMDAPPELTNHLLNYGSYVKAMPPGWFLGSAC